MGKEASASSTGAVAIGYQAKVDTKSNSVGTAIGYQATVDVPSGFNGDAFGGFSKVTGQGSVAVGTNASVSAVESVAIGHNSTAARDNTVSIGSLTKKRQLVNMAKGTEDDDGVNVAQLKPTVDALGGSAKIDATTGAVTGPNYTIQGESDIKTVGGALTKLDTAVSTNRATLTQIGNDLNSGSIGLVKQDEATGNITVAKGLGGALVDFSGEAGGRVLTGLANGVDDHDAVTLAQMRSTIATDIEGRMMSALQYDDVSLSRATLGGTDGTVIGNLANGLIASGSMEAVNGGQMYAMQQDFENRYNQLNDKVDALEGKVDEIGQGNGGGNGGAQEGSTSGSGSAAVGEGSSVVGDNGTALGNGATVAGPDGAAVNNGTAVGSGSKVTADNGTALGSGASVTAANGTALGSGASVSGANGTALGNGSVASGENSTAIGSGANASGNNSVALGEGSSASRDNTVSVGSAGNERQITNVADGTEATDAVNVRQLNSLRGEMQSSKRDSFGGVASAIAIANLPQAALAGESMVSIAGGTYGGQSAVAFGLSTATRDGKWVLKGSGSTNSRGTVAVGAGAGYRW
nr:YadA-like family protein [Trinickia mobilis]